MMNASMKWIQGMNFVCDNRGHQVVLDATAEHGGENKGPSPKELLLDAMMSCTAMDVVAILKKMRQEITALRLEIEAETTLEHPIHLKAAKITFYLEGPVIPEKALKAVASSLSKYCGVNYMVSKSCGITYEIDLNGKSIGEGHAQFS